MTAATIAREAASASRLVEGSFENSSLEEIKRHRLARTKGSLLPGINALAAPIFDQDGKLCLVVGMRAIAWNERPRPRCQRHIKTTTTATGIKDSAKRGTEIVATSTLNHPLSVVPFWPPFFFQLSCA